MESKDLRRVRQSLDEQARNIQTLGRLLRRLRRGNNKVRRRLDHHAETLAEKARQAAEPADDHWPRDSVEFGLAVRKARESAGLSRRGLAALTSLANQTLTNVERAASECRADTRRFIIETLEAKAREKAPQHDR
jgi:ribosome-binding protein aMBF1 (putative translation factor)